MEISNPILKKMAIGAGGVALAAAIASGASEPAAPEVYECELTSEPAIVSAVAVEATPVPTPTSTPSRPVCEACGMG